MEAVKPNTRAQALLQRVVASQDLTIAELADELVVTPRIIGMYLNGERPIPLARQMCLAKVIIDRVPRLARQGYQLRGQVAAVASLDGWVDVRV